MISETAVGGNDVAFDQIHHSRNTSRCNYSLHWLWQFFQ